MKPLIPILRSFDEAATRGFLVGFLGFDLISEHRFEPGISLYMGVKYGTCGLHLSEHFGDASPGSALRIEVDDVAAYAKVLNSKR